MSPRTERILLVLLLAAVALFHGLTIRPGFEWGGDFAQYLEHARNLAEGKSFADIRFIYNPSAPLGPPCTPPGFPVLLAPLVKMFGLNLTAFKIQSVAFFVIALALAYLLFREHLPPAYGLVLTAVLGFHPYFWGIKDYILAEFPFLCLLMLFLLVLRWVDGGSHWAWPLLAGLLAYTCYSLRAVALVLVGVPVIYELIRRRRFGVRSCLVAGSAGAFILLQHFVLRACGTVQYRLLDFDPVRMAKNLYYYGYWMTKVFPVALPTAAAALFVAATLVALVGFVKRIRSIGFPEIFLLLYFIPILLFTNDQGLRYLVPVIPFYSYYLFLGLRAMAGKLPGRFHALPLVMMAAAAMIGYTLIYPKVGIGAPIPGGPEAKDAAALFDFVRERMEPDAVVAFSKARALALWGERRSVVLAFGASDAQLWKEIEGFGATHLLLAPAFPTDQRHYGPFVQRNRERMDLIFRNSGFFLFRIRPQAE